MIQVGGADYYTPRSSDDSPTARRPLPPSPRSASPFPARGACGPAPRSRSRGSRRSHPTPRGYQARARISRGSPRRAPRERSTARGSARGKLSPAFGTAARRVTRGRRHDAARRRRRAARRDVSEHHQRRPFLLLPSRITTSSTTSPPPGEELPQLGHRVMAHGLPPGNLHGAVEVLGNDAADAGRRAPPDVVKPHRGEAPPPPPPRHRARGTDAGSRPTLPRRT